VCTPYVLLPTSYFLPPTSYLLPCVCTPYVNHTNAVPPTSYLLPPTAYFLLNRYIFNKYKGIFGLTGARL